MAADQSPILAALPLAAASLVYQRVRPRDEVEEVRRWWTNFYNASPSAVWQYVLDLADETQADPTFSRVDPDPWLRAHHPAWFDLLEDLHWAFRKQLPMPERLRHVQGGIVCRAWDRLAYQYAVDRKPITGGTWIDEIVKHKAADDLLAWSGREAHDARREPATFVTRWHEAGTTDQVTLERSGLFRLELQLLSS